ncbi:MAG TPA: ATP-binding protein [Thermoanaerobaculia bacterium]|nr:ATP-binding protein [Thermoanaerobaculia bacterium]
MKLRTKFILYFVALHFALAAFAVVVLFDHPVWLFAIEVAFAVSLVVGYRLTRALFLPLDLLRTGAELIGERDFATRFVPVGQREMDDLIAVYNDMIDRLREERLAAEERHQLLQKIVQASPSGILICDFDGNVEQMNPAAQRLATPEMLAELAAMEPGQASLLTLDGPRRVKVWRAEFRDRGFAKSFYLVEEMTEELRLSEKAAYEKLIRMMSHEVNNSVGAVRSLLDSALRWAPQISAADRDDYVTALTVASARIDALNRFMSGFADVVRMPPPHRGRVRVAGIVERIAALLRPDLGARNITLTLDLDETTAEADAYQLEQVVLNIARNAVDAVGRDGAIAIVLRTGALTVRDSGPGISDDVRASLFTPFFTTKSDGRGLGLTIVQEILTNHGFGYSLQNGVGGGAEFVVRFS